MINKILTAVALIFVIIASGIYIIKNTGSEPPPPPPVVEGPPVNPPSGEKEADKLETRTVGTTTASSDPVVIENPANDSLQPKYEPINRPEVLQNLREEGKTYKSHVLGKVTGSAFKKDWGVTGTSHFEYVYGFTSVGKILQNDGMTIIEERTFENVVDQVMVSEVEFGFDLPAAELGVGISVLSSIVGAPVDPVSTVATIQQINEVKIPVSASILNKISKFMPDSLDAEKIKNQLKLFTHEKGGLLLMGKTARITFTDGQGIEKVVGVNCTLTPEEVDAIKRSNYVMDHYLMPDREVRVGEKWNVRADVFAGLLDTHIKGDVEGGIQVERGADFRKKDGKLNYRLKLSDGNVVFRSREEGNVITGKLTGLKGTSIMPHESRVISEATMRGYAEYNKLSTDHLLFEAKMTIQPSFEVKYECEVIEEGGN